MRARIAVPVIWAFLIALGLGCYQLSLHDVLLGIHGRSNTGYDDSVYMGAAVRLIHGALPYRNFDMVHPPGIALLMSPVALLSELTGTRDAMAVARVITVLVASANSALAALVLRRHGPAAMVVSGTALALYPLAVTADHSLLLEPYLVFFCLIGAVLLFSRGLPDSRRRLILGGVAFGLAGLVKTWALFPAIAALLCCIPRSRTRGWPVAAGMAAGFGIPSLPFFLAAPSAFVKDVIVAQLDRRGSQFGNFSSGVRLYSISGLAPFSALHPTRDRALVGLAIVAVVVVAILVWRRRQLTRLDLYAVLALALVLAGLLSAPEFFDYYSYFPAAFVAVLIGVAAGQLGGGLTSLAVRLRHFDSPRRVLAGPRRFVAATPVGGYAAVLVAAAVLTGLVVPVNVRTEARYLSTSIDPATVVEAEIPAGACVVFDYPSIALNANRYVARGKSCPNVVDPFGMWLVRDDGSSPPGEPPLPAGFVSLWQGWLQQADYVVMFFPYDTWLPFTPALDSYFSNNYVLLSSRDDVYVYDHFDRVPSAAAARWIGRGIAATRTHQSDLAAADFRQAVATDPADVDAPFDLGVLEAGLGQTAVAVQYYQRAIFLDPRDTSALYNLGLLQMADHPAEALSLFGRILSQNPDSPLAELYYGRLLVRLGQVPAGQSDIAKAERLDPALKSMP